MGGTRAEILALDEAEASLARGEGRRVTSREEATQLADEIERRGIARVTAEKRLVSGRVSPFTRTEEEDVLILYMAHGSRDIQALVQP